MTKIVAAFLSNIEKLRTLSAFNPDRSATKKGHRLIAEPAACASESRRSTEGRTEGAGSRRRRRGEGEMKKKKMMMMKRMRREEKRRKKSLGASVPSWQCGCRLRAAGLNRDATRLYAP